MNTPPLDERNPPPNNVEDFNSRALERKARKPRPRPALPDWAERCIKDDMERIIPNLANVLVALRALPEVAEAFAYDSMLKVTILRKELPVAPGGESASSGPFRDPCVTKM
jgi:hypothetical protein